VVVSEDTDVFVLCVSFSPQVPCPLCIKCGSKTRTQYFDVKKVAQMLGADKCKALPGLHAFTGCDTVSAFAGKGKLKGLGLISKSAQHREALTLLGSHWDITDDLHKKLESFACHHYCSTLVESVNDLRYDLFLAKKGKYNHGNSLHALRHFLATGIWQTTNVQFGRGAWKLHLKCQVLLAVDGAWKVRIWPLTRKKSYLLLRQSWNFCHVTAKTNVFRTVVLVSRMV